MDEALTHFGVKGMRWGVRKTEPGSEKPNPKGELLASHTFSSGERMDMYRNPPKRHDKLLSRISSGYKQGLENYPQFTLRDKDGTEVGGGSILRTDKDTFYVDIIAVKKEHRGKGYATAAMNGIVKYAQKQGASKLTLDVPNDAADAQHIYSKMGFKQTGKNELDEHYNMEMPISPQKIQHAETWEEAFSREFSQVLIKNYGMKGGSMGHTNSDVSYFLKHYGIKGMRWGVRRSDPNDSSPGASEDHQRSASTSQKAKAGGGTRALSNRELQDFITRANLERQYSALNPSRKQQVLSFVGGTLLQVGKQEVTKIAAGVIAKQVANVLKK